MIKSLLSIYFMLIAFTSYPQMNKKTFVGGELNFSWGKRNSESQGTTPVYESTEKGGTLMIMPTAGYFISEHFALGLGVGYSYGLSTSDNQPVYSPSYPYATETKRNSAIFRPFVRYNHFVGRRVSIFGQLEASGGFGNNKMKYFFTDSVTTGKVNFHSFSTGIRPGIIVLITERIGIETTFGYLGYRFYKESRTSGYFSNTATETKYQFFDFDFGLSSLYFGIQFYFGGNGKEEDKGKEDY